MDKLLFAIIDKNSEERYIEQVGNWEVDLNDYATKTEVATALNDYAKKSEIPWFLFCF